MAAPPNSDAAQFPVCQGLAGGDFFCQASAKRETTGFPRVFRFQDDSNPQTFWDLNQLEKNENAGIAISATKERINMKTIFVTEAIAAF